MLIAVEETQVDHSGQSVATRALNVVLAVKGVVSAEVESESEKEATISYVWDPAVPHFQRIDEVLAEVNLRRVWTAGPSQ